MLLLQCRCKKLPTVCPSVRITFFSEPNQPLLVSKTLSWERGQHSNHQLEHIGVFSLQLQQKLVGGFNPIEMKILPNFRGENSKNIWVATTQKRSIDAVDGNQKSGIHSHQLRLVVEIPSFTKFFFNVPGGELSPDFSSASTLKSPSGDDLLVGPGKRVK